MRIARVHLQAFGSLRDFREDIAPGLHLFHGPNRAGKSTLQQAILALLYGFYEDFSPQGGNKRRQRYQPWTGNRYCGELEYATSNGRRFRVVRDFSSSDLVTTVSDAVTGADLTDEFGRGRHGNVPFMRRQTGMTRRVFEACAFVSQGELFQISGQDQASPQQIGDTIVNLADSARRDVSAQSAIDRIKKTLQEQVGPSANARTRPLFKTQTKLNSLKRQREEITLVQASVADDAEALEVKKSEADELKDALARSRFLATEAGIRELRMKTAQLDALDAQSDSLHHQSEDNRQFADFPIVERDSIRGLQTKADSLREELQSARPRIEAQRQRLLETETLLDELTSQERALSHLRSYPIEKKAPVEGLIASWRSAAEMNAAAERRMEQVAAGVQETLGDYEALRSEVGTLSPQDLRVLMQRLRVPSTSLVRSILRILSAPIRFAWKSFRRLLRKKNGTGTTGQDEPLVNPYSSISASEAESILEKQRRYLALVPDVRNYENEVQASERARTSLESVYGRLCEELRSAGEDAGDVEEAYARFSKNCADRAELDATTQQLRPLVAEKKSLGNAITEFESDWDRLTNIENMLKAQLESAVQKSGPIEDLISVFEEGCRRKALFDEAGRAVSAAEDKAGLILGGRSRAELAEMVQNRELEAREIVNANPFLAGAQTNEGSEALRERESIQERKLKQLEIAIQALSTRVSTKLDGLPSRAVVEEEIERTKLELASLERFGQSLKIAEELIGEAMAQAHREFAPTVGRFLADGLDRVTQGTYTEAQLDPSNFRVVTRVPEDEGWKEVDALSRGTQAAAYLLLRIGLAQHMATMSEPVPIILDDPLVDVDDFGIERFLELLVGLTEEIQILLFTKDETTATWFERNYLSNERHALTRLKAGRVLESLAAS